MSENFYYYGKYKQHQIPVRQESVSLVKADFRMCPKKKQILKSFAKLNKKTFSDVMRDLTDQAVELLKQAELEDL